MWITEILIFAMTAIATAFIWRWKRFLQLANKIPPSGFGTRNQNIFKFLIQGDTHTLYEELKAVFYKGGLSKTWMGHILFVNIITPEDAKIVFNSKTSSTLKPYFVTEFSRMPQGSLFGYIEPWQTHRKVLNSYFSQNGLRGVIPIFNDKANILVDVLGKEDGKGEFNVFYNMTALTLETILAVMEYDVDIQRIENKKERDVYIKNLETYAEVFALRVFKFWLYPQFIFNRSTIGKKQNAAVDKCGMVFAPKVIKQTRERLTEINEATEFNGKHANFIRALIDPRNEFTESELTDEIKSIIAAAQDTSAISTSATLMLLGIYKDVQAKLYEELKTILNSSEDYIDIEQLNQLEYLDLVINESMRVLPVVPMVFRTVEEEFVSHEGYVVPAGSQLCVPIFVIHRRKDVWGEDADEFNPERFRKENIKKIHPYAYMPFAKGARMCIGWRYATFLMKIQIAKAVMKYEIDSNLKLDELICKTNITLCVQQGFRISIKSRQN